MADKIVQEIEVVAKVNDAISKIEKLEREFKQAMRGASKEAKKLQTETKKTTEQTKKLSDTVETLGGRLKGAFTAAAVIAGIRQMGSLSGEFHRTTVALSKSLDDVNKGFQLENLQAFATEMETLSGVSDEVIRQLLLVGVNSGITGEALKALTRGSLGLASATGRDTVTMMTNLIKTLAGFKEESVKTIPEVVNLTREQLLQGEAIFAVDKKYSQFIETLSGPQGSLSKGITDLSVGFNNLLEDIGNVLGDMGLGKFLTGAGRFIKLFSLEAKRVFSDIEIVALNLSGVFVSIAKGFDESFLGGFISGTQDSPMLMDLADRLGQAQIDRAKNETDIQNLIDIIDGKKPDPTRRIPGPITIPGFGVDEEARKRRKKLEEETLRAMKAFDKKLLEEEEEFEKNRRDSISRIIDAQTNEKIKRIDFELSLEDFRIRELDKRLTEEENMRSRAFANLRNIAGSFAEESLGFLFDQADGEKKVFKEMLKNFLNATGQRLIGRGISDTLQGAAMLATGQPQGGVLMGIGAAEIAAGAAMRGGALLINTPSTDTASSAGVGGSMSQSQSDTQRINSGPRETVINIFGAMTTEESAILIERGMRQAEARGFA